MPYTQTRAQPWQEVAGMDGGKLFAVEGQVLATAATSSHPAGTVTLNVGTVPANTLWIVRSFIMIDSSSGGTVQILMLNHGGTQYNLNQVPGVAVNVSTNLPSSIVAFPGDILQAVFFSTGLNDTCAAYLTGHSMTIS